MLKTCSELGRCHSRRDGCFFVIPNGSLVLSICKGKTRLTLFTIRFGVDKCLGQHAHVAVKHFFGAILESHA